MKQCKLTTRAGAFLLTLAFTPVMAQTNHDAIHREFVELVRVMNKGQMFDCQRIRPDRTGCFFISPGPQRQTMWQFTSDKGFPSGSAIELCTTIASQLLEPVKETLTSVSGMLNERTRTSLLCTLKYVRAAR